MKTNLINFLLDVLLTNRLIALLPNYLLRRRNGQMALMMVLTTLMFLLIMVPVIEKFVQNEGKWSMKNRKTSLAFNMAEAGIDRAVWKLNENDENWDDAADGDVFTGYNNDEEYTDLEGGSYRIIITSGSQNGEIKIISTGKDFSSNEFRAIKAIYKTERVQAAVEAPTLQFNSSFQVFWGPVMSLSNISLNSSADELYPRKYAVGEIASSSSYGDRDTTNDANNTDCLEYWAFDDATCGSSGVPPMPETNIEWYREQSKIAPNEYYSSHQNFSSLQDNVPKIRFFEGNATFTGTTHCRGWIIGMGKVTFNVSGYDDPGYGSYTVAAADIPQEAWKEYQKNTPEVGNNVGVGCAGPCNGGGHGKVDDGVYDDDTEAKADSVCCEQYPGDAGYRTVSDYNFKTGRTSTNELGGHSGEPIAFKGFIHSEGQMDMNSSTIIHGAILAPGGFKGTSSGELFYDSSLDIELASDEYVRQSWYEVTPVEF